MSSNSTASFSGSGSGSEGSGGALYIILAIASPVVYSTVNVVDKTAVSTRVKHTPSYLSLIGIVDMIIAAIMAACCDWSAEAMSHVKAIDFIIPAVSGVAWAGSIYCYYMGMMLTDASIIVGVEYLYPLVVVVLSAIFLNEVIQPMGYVGCVLLVVGAISLSLNFVGMICKRRKRKKQMNKANEERGLVLGVGYGPFQKAVIPAGVCASINDAQTPEEAREAFNAMLNWRGAFVMPIMEEPKVNRVGDSYVDMEAGCAPGVDCWCPCGTYCKNCHKVVSTKGDEPKHGSKKKNKSKKDDSADQQQQQQAGGKTRSIDSRKSLESSRNARVRVASRAAVQATVDRPTPAYDDVVAEQKPDDGAAEEKKHHKKHHKDHKKKHHHHHHHKEGAEQSPVEKDKKLSSSEGDGDDSGEYLESCSYPADTTSTTSSDGKKSLDDDAIPLDDMGGDKNDEQAGDAEAAKAEEDSDEEAAEEKQEPEEETNCILRITAWCTRHKKSKGLLMLVLLPLVLLLALTEFLAKVATASLSTFNVCSINFFVYGFCMFAIFFVRPFKGPKYFMSELKRNWLFCLLSDVLTLGAQFLLIFAMSGMQASVVSSLAAIQPLITLCFERIFGIASDTLKECLSYKLVPIILVVTGVVLLSVAAI